MPWRTAATAVVLLFAFANLPTVMLLLLGAPVTDDNRAWLFGLMRSPRATWLPVAMAFAVGVVACTPDDTTSVTDPSPTVAASATGSPTAADADGLFVALPEGLSYAELAADVEEEVRTRLVSSEASKIIESWAVRHVEEGSVPLGTVLAMRLNDRATSADRRGILHGMEDVAGAEGEPVEVGGASATYIEAEDLMMLLHVGDDIVFTVFGSAREDVERVFEAVVARTASDGA